MTRTFAHQGSPRRRFVGGGPPAVGGPPPRADGRSFRAEGPPGALAFPDAGVRRPVTGTPDAGALAMKVASLLGLAFGAGRPGPARPFADQWAAASSGPEWSDPD
ncbi:MAG: hypothetical protein QOI74_1532 [Micromonosporaceae bacterium]|nr:hypothetical protein [Micromonosporaceae bacterium]